MSHDTERLRDLEEWVAARRPQARWPADLPVLDRRQGAGVLTSITAAHLVAIWMLVAATRGALPDPAPTTTLVFISEPSPPVVETGPEPEPGPPPVPAPPRPRPVALPLPRATAPSPTAPGAPARTRRTMVAVEVPAAPLRLFDEDGSLELPADVVARLEEVESAQRMFDFQQPGLLEAGAFMQRQPALVYEPTRFDAYWRPEQDVLTALLTEAVQRSVRTIEIPIPGSPGSKLICSISVLALGGGCGIRNNNDGYVPVLDDPDTLDPEEEAQCRAWWDQIVAGGSQEMWRQTRELYEFSCRKPPRRDDAPPGPPEPSPVDPLQ